MVATSLRMSNGERLFPALWMSGSPSSFLPKRMSRQAVISHRLLKLIHLTFHRSRCIFPVYQKKKCHTSTALGRSIGSDNSSTSCRHMTTRCIRYVFIHWTKHYMEPDVGCPTNFCSLLSALAELVTAANCFQMRRLRVGFTTHWQSVPVLILAVSITSILF